MVYESIEAADSTSKHFSHTGTYWNCIGGVCFVFFVEIITIGHRCHAHQLRIVVNFDSRTT